jgi:hypothetical protein
MVIFATSFDHYSTSQILKRFTQASITGPGTIVAGQGRCGSKALQLEAIHSLTKGLNLTAGASLDKGFFGFAYKLTLNTFNTPPFRLIAGDGFGTQFYLSVTSTGAIQARDGFLGGVLATTPNDVVHIGEYCFIECGFVLANAPDGVIIIRVNGVELVNQTGIDTLWSGPATYSGFALENNNNAAAYFDDLYFCDDFDDGLTPPTNTFLGDVHCEYDRPESDGTYVGEWTVVGGGAQWEAIDKDGDPSATTPSIQSSVSGNRATDNYVAAAVVSGTVFNVGVHILAEKSDSGSVTIAPLVRRAGTDALGDDFAPPESASIYESTEYNRDPTDGAAWTIAKYNAAEYGVEDTRP